jgi:hypothetical protein
MWKVRRSGVRRQGRSRSTSAACRVGGPSSRRRRVGELRIKRRPFTGLGTVCCRAMCRHVWPRRRPWFEGIDLGPFGKRRLPRTPRPPVSNSATPSAAAGRRTGWVDERPPPASGPSPPRSSASTRPVGISGGDGSPHIAVHEGPDVRVDVRVRAAGSAATARDAASPRRRGRGPAGRTLAGPGCVG